MANEFAPKIKEAPGLVWRKRTRGWAAYWFAHTYLVSRGWLPRSVHLWTGEWPDEFDTKLIQDQCSRIHSEMLMWGRGGAPAVSAFDGTIKSLVNCYQNDADSPYHTIRFRTRQNYQNIMRKLIRDHGDEHVSELKARAFRAWHAEWSAGGKLAMGHSMVGILRTVIGFGATYLEDDHCIRLKAVLHDMRFPQGKSRTQRMTAEQAIAIRAKAHEMGWHYIALAQAFQFELMLRQRDVIGEWVPVSEPGVSDVTYDGEKWIRGLRWSEIDQNKILRHTTSKRQKDIEVDLRLAPMVMEELSQFMGFPNAGPVIINEETGRPFRAERFRAVWREIARAAGVPDDVFNMDSRAGGISEATDAGADLEHVRHAATHSDIAMTQRYSRNSAEKVGNVMRLRVEHRNRK